MEHKHINIISFNVPYPPSYGGVIDVYYKIKALFEQGIKIHLHCFQYGRNKSDELESICEEVFYYKRDSFWKGFFSDKPFIVQSRNDTKLRKALLDNTYPILFEGLHSCFFLTDGAFRSRLRIVRMHNNEAAYYLRLAHHENKLFTQLYYYLEYRRLMKYEQVLAFADKIMCISPAETAHYKKRFKQTTYLAPFHGNAAVTTLKGTGTYALYHGNLEINENVEAALFLVNSVFNDNRHQLIIAGNNPSRRIREAIAGRSQIQLIENPVEDHLQELIHSAHVHVLPTFTETGIKLKLLSALFNGRFCLVNSSMVKETGLEKYCVIADEAIAMKEQLDILFAKEFTDADLEFRKQIETEFSDRREAQKIISLL